MRKDVNLKSRTKNSFIYFQLGLIGTMLAVLFVLEFRFKDSVDTIIVDKWDDDSIETPFNATYTIIEHKMAESKPVKAIKPIVKIPLDVTKLDVKKNEEEVDKTDLNSQDNANSNQPVETKNVVVENYGNSNTTGTKPEITFVNVEQLPMFPECKGLSRSAQKECFDEQLMKAVLRNLKYPEEDYEKGNQGRALIEFVIDEKGNITNVKAIDNNRATNSMQLAAEKAVKKLPKLIPAKMGDENVRIKYSIPISFRIQ